MPRDLKMGMLFGLAFLVAAVVWLSTRPNLSAKARVSWYGQHSDDRASGSSKSDSLTGKPRQKSFPDAAASEETEDTASTTVRPADSNQGQKRVHIVRQGDTLSGISEKYYGSPNAWRRIFEANRFQITDPDKVKTGTRLIIPE